MQQPKIKLRVEPGYSLNEIQELVNKGARFILFQYCVSIVFAVTLKRFSPAILVQEGEDTSRYRLKYNLISLIFGWWGFPWGPIKTIESLFANYRGGVDYTSDIMLNLTKESILSKEVEIQAVYQKYSKPSKSDIRAFRKSLLGKFEFDLRVNTVIVAIFIDTATPHYVVAIKADVSMKVLGEEIIVALNKQFLKATCFEFIDLNDGSEKSFLLAEQGEIILKR